MEATSLDIQNKVLGSFAKYNSHLEYSKNDCLLKLVQGTTGPQGRKQPVERFLDTLSSAIAEDVSLTLTSFLDLLLVKNSEFISKYIDWLTKLANLNRKVYDLEHILLLGKMPDLHVGMVIHSALADTENKIRDQFGGKSWKRIMNFPLLTRDNFTGDPLHQVGIGGRYGASFVGLVQNNIPNHYHMMENLNLNSGDVWKLNSSGNNAFVTGRDPGLAFGDKKIYPEVAPLNWNEDLNGSAAPTSGAARYVRPHFNVPPYKDVYIWQCTELKPSTRAHTFDELQTAPVQWAAIKRSIDEVMGDTATTTSGELMFDEVATFIDDTEEGQARAALLDVRGLSDLTKMDAWYMLISDELLGGEALRYESKDAPLKDIENLASWYVWCKVRRIERRYLFKEVYKYLIEDIQDRIYLLMQRIIAIGAGNVKVKERVVKGEYVFICPPTNKTDEEILAQYYKLPTGSEFIKVSNVFLRGTSLFTKETLSLYTEYCTNVNKNTNRDKLTTAGGLRTVNLYADNFPKHLHWSMLLNEMPSIRTVVPGTPDKSGGEGTAMLMNDPRTGGTKYCGASGSGSYELQTKTSGSTSPVIKINIPNYVLMSVYLVS